MKDSRGLTGVKLGTTDVLTQRHRQILNLAVSHFIKTAEPVASRTLMKVYRLPYGAATIRNEMADLEEMGYLEQPHTSAGRIPTDKGYREYVNSLRDFPLTNSERSHLEDMERQYFSAASEFQGILLHAVRLLADITNMVGIAALPQIKESHIEKIQLLEVGRRRVMVVLVTQSGVVESRVVGVDVEFPQDVLDQISRIFNENFSHTSIKDFVGQYIDVLQGMRLEFRTAVKALLEKFFEEVGAGQTELNAMVLESGQAVFQQPEFSNFERARELLTAFEYKEGIAKVVSQLRDFGTAPAVTIGAETRTRILKDLSMVVTSYTSGGLERGTIGIIGPRRMNYPKVIASVDYISKLLTRTLMKVPV